MIQFSSSCWLKVGKFVKMLWHTFQDCGCGLAEGLFSKDWLSSVDLGHPMEVSVLRRDIELKLDGALVNDKTSSLYWTRYCTGGWGRSTRTGLMRSDNSRCVMVQATEFCIRCSLPMWKDNVCHCVCVECQSSQLPWHSSSEQLIVRSRLKPRCKRQTFRNKCKTGLWWDLILEIQMTFYNP
jgi:hypothetical protein